MQADDPARARRRVAWDGLVGRVRADRRLGDGVADALARLVPGAPRPEAILRALELQTCPP